MIFGSLGFLVVSAFLLAFGIGKASVPMLVMAFLASAVAGVLLLAAYRVHREGAAPAAAPALPGVQAQAAAAQPMAYVLVPVGAEQAVAAQPVVGNGPGAGGEPLVGYAGMTAAQVVGLVNSGILTDDQLEAIRAHEVAHQGRKRVLAAIDAQVMA